VIVYFLRHASAGQSLADPKKDEKRPLDDDGTIQSRYIGRALAASDITVDAIISSPLKRARQTATIVANELGFEQKIEVDGAMRPEATYAQFQALLKKYQAAESIIVVGHNPSMEQFLSRIIGRQGHAAAIDLKKGAIAKVDVKRLEGTLQWCITPKLVGSIHSLTKSSLPKTSRK
jgi:phosphohistidine phosphatase